MADNKTLFDEFFAGQTFGPRDGFEPRDFQITCLLDYQGFLKQPVVFGPERKAYVIYGGTGVGKTKLAGLLGSHVLNVAEAEQIIVVVPNRSIRTKTKADFMKFFGIDLARFDVKKHSDGIPRMQQGYILTYNALMNDPALHKKLCKCARTLVIFDEIHHLGDHPGSMWGARSTEAFGEAAHIIGLTGTPYRTEGVIPLVEYEPTAINGILRFKANFTYPLGRAVADCLCREPAFDFRHGTVMIRDALGHESLVSFEDKVSDEVAATRLRGAVAYGSTDRRQLLRVALAQCRAENRKVIIFLGGDTCGEQSPTEDATLYLPLELQQLGYGADDYDVVTGDDKTSQKRIEEFPHHPTKWILVTINMVSEGTDIPPISAAIFLTSITAKQTTVQRIGRALRLMENDPHPEALIFMFAHPALEELAREIKEEIKAEVNLKRRKDRDGGSEGPSGPRRRPEAIGVGDAPQKVVVFANREFPADVFQKALERRREKGLPATYQQALLALLMGE